MLLQYKSGSTRLIFECSRVNFATPSGKNKNPIFERRTLTPFRFIRCSTRHAHGVATSTSERMFTRSMLITILPSFNFRGLWNTILLPNWNRMDYGYGICSAMESVTNLQKNSESPFANRSVIPWIYTSIATSYEFDRRSSAYCKYSAIVHKSKLLHASGTPVISCIRLLKNVI